MIDQSLRFRVKTQGLRIQDSSRLRCLGSDDDGDDDDDDDNDNDDVHDPTPLVP